jgi:tRNA-specific 2-thiouridylase
MSEFLTHPERVMVALSGGVDSSVAAALLIEQGYSVVGVTLRFLPGTGGDTVEHAARCAADELGIELKVVDCSEEFEQRVIRPFCHAYLEGLTPNPCAVCNREFKFGFLRRLADEGGCKYLATGHYARVISTYAGVFLRRGIDTEKDQSYFMFSLADMDLERVLFPLGEMDKSQVRAAARRFGLSATRKAESQDICFVPDNDYKHLVQQHIAVSAPGGTNHGDIVHVDGTVLGRHEGIYSYTVGQRRGLGIAWHEPLYVVRLDAEHCHVIVGEKQHLYQKQIRVRNVVWGMDVSREDSLQLRCQIRYRQRPVDALVYPRAEQATVSFDAPLQGVSPGQAAVFYRDDLIVGGGWIS